MRVNGSLVKARPCCVRRETPKKVLNFFTDSAEGKTAGFFTWTVSTIKVNCCTASNLDFITSFITCLFGPKFLSKSLWTLLELLNLMSFFFFVTHYFCRVGHSCLSYGKYWELGHWCDENCNVSGWEKPLSCCLGHFIFLIFVNIEKPNIF